MRRLTEQVVRVRPALIIPYRYRIATIELPLYAILIVNGAHRGHFGIPIGSIKKGGINATIKKTSKYNWFLYLVLVGAAALRGPGAGAGCTWSTGAATRDDRRAKRGRGRCRRIKRR